MAYLSMAALQLELCVEDNLSLIEKEIDLVKKRFPWVQLVVLPELCTFGPSTRLAVGMPGEVENCFREAALKNDLWLIPGSIFERRGQDIYNTAPVINPQGEVIARYRKQYPFLPYEKGVTAGDDFVVFDIPGAGRIGLIICYDMWFPETVRTLAWMGAEAVICPSLTNTIDREVELAIARSNAATNQLYFFKPEFGRPTGSWPDHLRGARRADHPPGRCRAGNHHRGNGFHPRAPGAGKRPPRPVPDPEKFPGSPGGISTLSQCPRGSR